MKSKWILGLCMLFMMLCQTAFSENVNVLSEDVYYGEAAFYQVSGDSLVPITTITDGTVRCEYSVIMKSKTPVAMIAALYCDGVLQTAKAAQRTIEEKGEALYSADLIVSAQDDEIRLFLVRDLSVASPIKTLATLSEKSCAKDVTSFSLGKTAAQIQHIANRILLRLPYGTDLSSGTPEVTVSPGATYAMDGSDFSKKIRLTVTAEDQSRRDYIIETEYENQNTLYDFEAYRAEVGAESYDADLWKGPSTQNTDIKEVIREIDENQVLYLSDQSLTARADVRGINWNVSAPFTLSCRINYQLPEGVTERSAENDFSYCTFWAINENTINLNQSDFYFCGFEPVWDSGNFCFNYYKNGKRVKSNLHILPSAWYEVTMKYYQAEDGSYYTDYLVKDEDENITEFKKIPSGRTETRLTGFYLLTSPGRRANVLLDDVRIKEDADRGAKSYTQTFEDGMPTDWNGGTLVSANGGTALEITDRAEASLPDFIGDASLTFDISLSDIGTNGTVLTFGSDEEAIGRLCVINGKWGYEKNGQAIAFSKDAAMEPDHFSRIKIEYVYDAVYENSRLDIEIDGCRLGSIIPEATPDVFDTLCFTAPSGGSMKIDQISVEKR